MCSARPSRLPRRASPSSASISISPPSPTGSRPSRRWARCPCSGWRGPAVARRCCLRAPSSASSSRRRKQAPRCIRATRPSAPSTAPGSSLPPPSSPTSTPSRRRPTRRCSRRSGRRWRRNSRAWSRCWGPVLSLGPFFAGGRFSLVDAAFGPVFRYFDVFDSIADLGILTAKPKIAAWRAALADRPSVRTAVAPDYPERLRRFLDAQDSHLRGMMRSKGGPPG